MIQNGVISGYIVKEIEWRNKKKIVWQLLREKNFKQSIPRVKVEEGEEMSYEMAWDAMRRGAHFLAAIQASDGHWPSETSGPLFYLCPLLICMYIMGFMDTAFTPEHKKEMMRYVYNHQVNYFYHSNSTLNYNIHVQI